MEKLDTTHVVVVAIIGVIAYLCWRNFTGTSQGAIGTAATEAVDDGATVAAVLGVIWLAAL